MPIGRLHILTDYYFQQRYSHDQLAGLAIEGGADTIQFRQKDGSVRHHLPQIEAVLARCREQEVPLIVNDRFDVALVTGSDGVHVGQGDLSVSAIRRVEHDLIVGATATTTAQALAAEEAGASYVGFGPVFPTNSKANPASVKGLRALRTVCEAVSIPVIAIAGITPERIPEVMEAGAHGIAVMTYVSLASDPRAATARLREAVDQALG